MPLNLADEYLRRRASGWQERVRAPDIRLCEAASALGGQLSKRCYPDPENLETVEGMRKLKATMGDLAGFVNSASAVPSDGETEPAGASTSPLLRSPTLHSSEPPDPSVGPTWEAIQLRGSPTIITA
ncbi:hypothetical protein CCHR01_07769 [Colletotrichum chrysophilum]|uniref:Uncharacterized protein n=1 Tax=Colletotrichum chrysophilum TaxID=1836956 RepID=A0AAD9ALK9_9PEZI|nr:hypothetical protein CCHR01_07769 [Colletotrichum chrysophilum]